jgi:predicted Ser/Thr protein kinase
LQGARVTANDQVDELLLRWEAARAEGARLSAEQLCGDCPQLVEAVRKRIHAIEEMEQVLGVGERHPPETQIGTGMFEPADPLDALPRIPGYEVLRVLDQGGMGVVFEARQVELGRKVAVKMIANSHLDAALVARFRKEAESVARLHHPNVIQIFEVGQVGGRPFFSMEYVGGGNLKQRLAQQPMTPRQAAEVVEALARAVHLVHELGIIHRDLKPANVMLATDGTPKITDFGIAKRLDEELGQTLTGEVMGTPSYMAPEQAEGDKKQIGRPTDVYGLGAIFYEMLTGRPPFEGTSALAAMKMVTTEEPTPPSAISPNVPADLEAICLKCLEKSPARRYPSAQDLADDLRRFLSGQPVTARPAGRARRAWRWVRQHPGIVALVLLVLILAMIPLGLYLRVRHEKQQLRRRAEQLAPQVREILQRNCFECHGHADNPVEKQLDILDHDLLLNSTRKIVVSGAPDESRLIQRIDDGSMPPEEEELRLPRVTEKELVILREWILGGAPPLPPEGPDNPIPPVVESSELADRVHGIFEAKCYECHKYDEARGGIKIFNHRLLVNVRKVVVPGYPDQSDLVELLTTPDEERRMPPVPEPRLSAEEIEVIREWIREGARPFSKR